MRLIEPGGTRVDEDWCYVVVGKNAFVLRLRHLQEDDPDEQ